MGWVCWGFVDIFVNVIIYRLMMEDVVLLLGGVCFIFIFFDVVWVVFLV